MFTELMGQFLSDKFFCWGWNVLKQVYVIYVRADFLLILICMSSSRFSYLHVGGVTCLIKLCIVFPALFLGKGPSERTSLKHQGQRSCRSKFSVCSHLYYDLKLFTIKQSLILSICEIIIWPKKTHRSIQGTALWQPWVFFFLEKKVSFTHFQDLFH